MTQGACTPEEAGHGGEAREGLTMARYAEVMAHLRHFPRDKGAEVIVRLGLSEARWGAAVAAFTAAMAEESAREEEALSRQFGQAFMVTAQRLKRERPELPSLGPLPGARPDEATAPTDRPPAPAPVPGAPPPAVPTYLAAMPPRDRGAPAMPVAALAAAPAPAAAAASAAATASAAASAVASASAAAPAGASATASAPAAAAVPPTLVPPGMRHFTSVGGTHEAPPGAPQGPALPFQPPEVKPAGPATADLVPPGMRHFGSVGQTHLAAPAPDRPATPFEAPAPRPAPPAKEPPAPASKPQPAPPLISLEQYASLRVEVALEPAKVREILARYRVTNEQRAALDAYWQGRIAGEPELRAAYDGACSTYRQWLIEQRRKHSPDR